MNSYDWYMDGGVCDGTALDDNELPWQSEVDTVYKIPVLVASLVEGATSLMQLYQ